MPPRRVDAGTEGKPGAGALRRLGTWWAPRWPDKVVPHIDAEGEGYAVAPGPYSAVADGTRENRGGRPPEGTCRLGWR